MEFAEIGEKAWETLQQDSVFLREVPEAAQALFGKSLKALPERLGTELLDGPATIEAIVAAKVEFIKISLENGFIADYLAATGQPVLMSELMEAAFEIMIVTLEEFAADLEEYLVEYRIKRVTMY